MGRSTDAETLPADSTLGRSALRVQDRESVAEYYQTVVGLEELRSGADVTILGAGETPLLVLTEASTGESRTPKASEDRTQNAAGLYHNAFRVPTREHLGDALQRLREHDALEGAADHRVSEALYSSDPDGNGVEIYRDYPREDWPTTGDGRVAMTTDPLDLDGVAAAGGGGSCLPQGSDLGHVHLEVTSLAAFRDCYVDALGFGVSADLPGAAFVSAGGYHHHVGANVWHQRRERTGGPGLAWFEVVVPDADALASARDRLAASGFSIGEPADWFGSTPADGFAVTDSDGIQIRLRTP
jgi:catechol 2,3-dioxygenase